MVTTATEEGSHRTPADNMEAMHTPVQAVEADSSVTSQATFPFPVV
jgi:hypothetical protein